MKFDHLSELFKKVTPYIAGVTVTILASTALGQQVADPDLGAINKMETTASELVKELRTNLCKVCRDGSARVNTGTLISSEGYILTSSMRGLAEDDLPYFIILENGQRVLAETVGEPYQGALLLKVELPENSGLFPASLPSEDGPHASEGAWYLYASWNGSPIEKEIVRIHFARVLRAGESNIDRFTVDASITNPGSPLFDLNGNFVALMTKATDGKMIASCIPLLDLYSQWDSLGKITKELKQNADSKPIDAGVEVLKSSKEGATFRKHLVNYCDKHLPTPSLVAIFEDEKPIIYGTVINKDGLILSKASELGANLFCKIDGEMLPATLLATDEKTDLAILSVDATDLIPVQWSDSKLKSGTWLYSRVAEIDNGLDGSSIGSFSHEAPIPRNHSSLHSPERQTTMGVVLEHSSNSCKIAAIVPESPITKTDAKRLDTITHIDGVEVPNRNALTALLEKHSSGDEIELTLQRGEQIITTELSLSASYSRASQTESVNSTDPNFLPSIRSYGFEKVIIHDSPVTYWQCGGPLQNLKGEVFGINIAHHSKGVNYALPVDVIREAVKRMLSKSLKF